jgi:hypothetical protein
MGLFSILGIQELPHSHPRCCRAGNCANDDQQTSQHEHGIIGHGTKAVAIGRANNGGIFCQARNSGNCAYECFSSPNSAADRPGVLPAFAYTHKLFVSVARFYESKKCTYEIVLNAHHFFWDAL